MTTVQHAIDTNEPNTALVEAVMEGAFHIAERSARLFGVDQSLFDHENIGGRLLQAIAEGMTCKRAIQIARWKGSTLRSVAGLESTSNRKHRKRSIMRTDNNEDTPVATRSHFNAKAILDRIESEIAFDETAERVLQQLRTGKTSKAVRKQLNLKPREMKHAIDTIRGKRIDGRFRVGR